MSRVPFYVHFFDWFREQSWIEDRFSDKLDWSAIGWNGEDRSSKAFYLSQFEFLKSLGVDGICWELNLNADLTLTLPSPDALEALRESGLKICPFLDLEISYKVVNSSVESMTATLNKLQSIVPTKETAEFINHHIFNFYSLISDEIRGRDLKGRELIFVFGFGFKRDDFDPAQCSNFAMDLIAQIQHSVDHPIFYWSFSNAQILEHLLLHHRDHFAPFHFVLDSPLAQFGHSSVTWNFGFDNHGVAQRDGLERVVRNDLRYYQEMGWLACATLPDVVFIYSWNEAFEGSMLIPTELWGDTKARLAKHFIERVRRDYSPPLPKTLIIVDDLAESRGDWHKQILREMLWYPFRRLAPQSDVIMAYELPRTQIGGYSFIVDATVRKTDAVRALHRSLRDDQKLMFFCPLASVEPFPACDAFAESQICYMSLGAEARIDKSRTSLFVRDDVCDFKPSRHCIVYESLQVGTKRVPLISQVGNLIWVNAYTNHDEVLGHAFSVLYGIPCGTTILYGEGLESQRLQVDPAGEKKLRSFRRRSVNQRWTIPADIDLTRLHPTLSRQDERFVFGLDNE